MTTNPAAPTRAMRNGHQSSNYGVRAVLIPDADLAQVVFEGLTLCNSNYDVHCGLTAVPASRAPETIAATDDVPVRMDWLQHELRQGPGLDTKPVEVLAVKNLAADGRWPDFGKMCVAVMNVRSIVAIRIPLATRDRASLSFYSSEPTAFEHLDIDAALRLARIAAPRITRLISEFREPLLEAASSDCSRVAIALATVMARYRVSSSDAFGLLRQTSRDMGRPLLDVAIETALKGWLPQDPSTRVPGRRGTEDRPGQQEDDHARFPNASTGASLQGVQNPKTNAGETDADAALSIGGPEIWRGASPVEDRRRPTKRLLPDPVQAETIPLTNRGLGPSPRHVATAH